jgi:hypothetical protein
VACLRLLCALRAAVTATARKQAGSLPLYYTEYNDGLYEPPYHDTSYAAAFIVKNVHDVRVCLNIHQPLACAVANAAVADDDDLDGDDDCYSTTSICGVGGLSRISSRSKYVLLANNCRSCNCY